MACMRSPWLPGGPSGSYGRHYPGAMGIGIAWEDRGRRAVQQQQNTLALMLTSSPTLFFTLLPLFGHFLVQAEV